ncbi:MAG: insulinase family protein [Desulfofustis sp.]|nr:insulinase family protein [Desulfofustis sp.]
MKSFFVITSILIAALFSGPRPGISSAPDTSCYATGWPHEASDLKPDPSLHFGRLDNGFRYVLKRNLEPRNRVGIYLNVEAGSIYEQDSEQGIAHFLEHLLFNGTTHFKPGELIDYFQSIGMSFGADVNGYTTYTDTVYKLNLPSNTSDTLDQGFLVMRDYADGALLLDEEIERERGVILAEKTARDSAAYRSSLARTAFVMKNTIVPRRPPIGVESVLKHAERDDFQTFYRRWYRPDNMVLVAVGDFDMAEAEKLIKKHFASMDVELQGQCPVYGAVDHRGLETFYHHEPEIGATDVFIESIRNKIPQDDSLALQVENLHRHLAAMIVNDRLSRLGESADTPFSSASYYDSELFDRFLISGIKARTRKEDWGDALAAIDGILEQVLRYGVTDAEVERVSKEVAAELENSVLGADTRDSQHLINQIISHVDANRVMLSPQQELELFEPMVERVTREDINRAIKRSWPDGERAVQVVGDAELTMDGGIDELRDFYAGLAARPIEPPEQPPVVSFPYLAVAEAAAEPVEVTDYPDIEARRIDFANGLIVNVKKTSFKQNQVRAVLHFGSGRASVPEKGLDMLAASLVNGSGTATLKASELQEALAGSSIRYRFRIGDESFSIAGQAVSSEAELLLQTIYAMLMDPGFREEEYRVAMKSFDTMYRRFEQDIGGAERLHVDAFFTSNAEPSGLPEWDRFRTYTRDEVVKWLVPYFRNGPLELTIVGDIDEDHITALAGRYFGTLPARSLVWKGKAEAEFPVGTEYEVSIESTIDKALVKSGWLTDDDRDMSRTRRLHVLAAIFEERLRLKMREELGKTYSPTVYSVASRIYPGYGALFAELVVDRASIDLARDVLAGIGASFHRGPIGEGELERAREPIITSIRDMLRSNGYWLNTVLALSSRDPRQLTWPVTVLSDFESITTDQLDELARIYIRDDRRATAVVRPNADSAE